MPVLPIPFLRSTPHQSLWISFASLDGFCSPCARNSGAAQPFSSHQVVITTGVSSPRTLGSIGDIINRRTALKSLPEEIKELGQYSTRNNASSLRILIMPVGGSTSMPTMPTKLTSANQKRLAACERWAPPAFGAALDLFGGGHGLSVGGQRTDTRRHAACELN